VRPGGLTGVVRLRKLGAAAGGGVTKYRARAAMSLATSRLERRTGPPASSAESTILAKCSMVSIRKKAVNRSGPQVDCPMIREGAERRNAGRRAQWHRFSSGVPGVGVADERIWPRPIITSGKSA